jgi:bacillithiol system protein YtxJ
MIKWQSLTSLEDLDKLCEESNSKKVVIFKHSTACPLSSIAKMRLEEDWDKDFNVTTYYLDLIKYRNISNEVAARFAVHHESPQVIVIEEGECILDESHLDISINNLREFLI